LFRDPDLNVLVAEEQWQESEHELARRLDVLESRGLSKDRRRDLESEVQALLDNGAIDVVPRANYERLRDTALRRVPRDERDWPTVALAISLNVAILTAHNDFLGCGCATWTVETLIAAPRSR
jgi:predicted nucleic acid-binding protein